jgi:hypothetical protein
LRPCGAQNNNSAAHNKQLGETMSRHNDRVALAGIALLATLVTGSALAATHYAKPLAHPVGAPQSLAQRMSVSALAATRSAWTPLTNQQNFIDGAASTC